MPLEPEIFRNITRSSTESLAALGKFGVATAHESYARTGYMQGIAPATPGATIAGSAVTCLNYAGDNLMIMAAIDLAEPGDVLVVSVVSPSAHGMFGEVLATACASRGIAGVILDAGARDLTALRQMGFPVWSRHIAAHGTVKNSPGWVNVPVVCGGQIVNPGDAVIADDDGVMVVRRNDADAVAERSRLRLEKEAQVIAGLRAGASPMDKDGRREFLAPYVREENVDDH